MKRLTINIPGDRDKLYKVIRYPAGEIQVRLTEEGIFACTGKDEYIIVANPIPDIIELAQLKDALDAMPVKWYWTRLDLPYMPYARADRRFTAGDSFGLAVFARFINALGFHTVDTFDVHSAVAKQHIPSLINLDPIHDYDQLTPIIKQLGKGLALIAPDKGARTRYDLDSYDLPVLEGGKIRDAKTGALTGFSINPYIRSFDKALIVDDICDGGGTFIGLAKAIHELNPTIELYLYTSHGIYSKGLLELKQHFKELFVSDFTFRDGHTNFSEI